jgi:hypothetical protein
VWRNLVRQGARGAPSSRSGAAAAYDTTTNTMTIFGGNSPTVTFLSDTWVLSNANGIGGTPAWTRLNPTAFNPGALKPVGSQRWNGAAMDSTNNVSSCGEGTGLPSCSGAHGCCRPRIEERYLSTERVGVATTWFLRSSPPSRASSVLSVPRACSRFSPRSGIPANQGLQRCRARDESGPQRRPAQRSSCFHGQQAGLKKAASNRRTLKLRACRADHQSADSS